MRDIVTFIVPPGTPDVPAGHHCGYIDWTTVWLQGQSVTQMACCMLHLERSDFPELFSQNNTMVSMDVDVTALMKKGAITYDQYLVQDSQAYSGA